MTDAAKVYLLAPRGRVLHLAVFAYNAPRDGLGRYVTICGQDRGYSNWKRGWRITGSWAELWNRQRTKPLCPRCLGRLELLNACTDIPPERLL